MAQYKNPAVAMTADRYTYPVDCRRWTGDCSFQIIGVETGTPVGVFKFQGSNDEAVANDLAFVSGSGPLYGTSSETAKWTTLTLPSTAVIHGATAAFSITLPGTDIAYNGTAALNATVILQPTMRWMRLWFDYTSGGSAASLLTVYAKDDSE